MIIDFSSRPPVAALTPNAPSHLKNYRRVYAASESVHHCNYFVQPRTIASLRTWLQL